MSDKPGRGGARAGAGRKAKDGVSGWEKKTVNLDAASIAMASALGGGEVSVGIRRALRLAMAAVEGAGWIDAMRADMVARTAKPEAPRAPQPSKVRQREVLNLILGDHERKVARNGG